MSHLADGTLHYRMDTVTGYAAEGEVKVTAEQWAQIQRILAAQGTQEEDGDDQEIVGPFYTVKELIAAMDAPAAQAMSFDEAFDSIDWDEWRMQPIRELVRHLHGLTGGQMTVGRA